MAKLGVHGCTCNYVFQTLSGFHQLYNAAVEEDEILVVYKNNIFPYAHQCNEATLAFAYALNRTMAGML